MDQDKVERPIGNINLSDFTNEELSKYLKDIQQLPNKRKVAVVTAVYKNIEALLHEKKQVKIEFIINLKRPQTIKKDEKIV